VTKLDPISGAISYVTPISQALPEKQWNMFPLNRMWIRDFWIHPGGEGITETSILVACHI